MCFLLFTAGIFQRIMGRAITWVSLPAKYNSKVFILEVKHFYLCLAVFYSATALVAQTTQTEKELSIDANYIEILGMLDDSYIAMSIDWPNNASVFGIGTKDLGVRWQAVMEYKQKYNKANLYFVDAVIVKDNVHALFIGKDQKGVVIYRSVINFKGEKSELQEYLRVPSKDLELVNAKIIKTDGNAVLRITNASQFEKQGLYFVSVVNMLTHEAGASIQEFDISFGLDNKSSFQETLSKDLVYAAVVTRNKKEKSNMFLHKINVKTAQYSTRTIAQEWEALDVNIAHDETVNRFVLGGSYGQIKQGINITMEWQGFFTVQLDDSLNNDITNLYPLKDGLQKYATSNWGNKFDRFLAPSAPILQFKEVVSGDNKKCYYIFEDTQSNYQSPIYMFRRMLVFEFNSGKLENVHFFPKNIYASSLVRKQEKGYLSFFQNKEFHVAFPLSFEESRYVDFDYGLENPSEEITYLMDIKIEPGKDVTYTTLRTIDDDMKKFALGGIGIGTKSPYQPIFVSEEGILFNKIMGNTCYLLLTPFE